MRGGESYVDAFGSSSFNFQLARYLGAWIERVPGGSIIERYRPDY